MRGNSETLEEAKILRLIVTYLYFQHIGLMGLRVGCGEKKVDVTRISAHLRVQYYHYVGKARFRFRREHRGSVARKVE